MKIEAKDREDFEKQYKINSNITEIENTIIDLKCNKNLWDSLLKEAKQEMKKSFIFANKTLGIPNEILNFDDRATYTSFYHHNYGTINLQN